MRSTGRPAGSASRREHGQAALELLIVFPLLFSLVLLALAVASVWYRHQLSAALVLETASRESVRPGWGRAFLADTGAALAPGSQWSVAIRPGTAGDTPRQRLTLRGRAVVPWAPFGLDWSIPIQATTVTPAWHRLH